MVAYISCASDLVASCGYIKVCWRGRGFVTPVGTVECIEWPVCARCTSDVCCVGVQICEFILQTTVDSTFLRCALK
jgi:hypothetical protein